MHNDSTIISANEINRYVYCHYQWYYRRYYGDKKLTLLKKERNQALGIKQDARIHAFTKGNRFHRRHHRWYRIKKVIYFIVFITALIFMFYLMWSWEGL